MSHGYHTLTEKEKQTLRLVVRGHDAKSMARALDISVHTVNERLRHARRKMNVSSSKGAARMLLEAESGSPKSLVPKQLGADPEAVGIDKAAAPNVGDGRRKRLFWIIGGIAIMSLFAATLALTLLSHEPAAMLDTAPDTDAAVIGEVENSARSWLALVDDGKWEESWNAAGQTFRDPNTLEGWTSISTAVRPPLGEVLSRETGNQVDVPAPPTGYRVIQFRTAFANKAPAIETVSLQREDGVWRVVGYYIA